MPEHTIIPEKVTKPIQLLAAWLVGLIAVNGSFLVAAAQIDKPDWASGMLLIACVSNVPIFIAALFLLQTKFRPQMQEDSYYAKYLEGERQNGKTLGKPAAEAAEAEVKQAAREIIQSIGAAAKGQEEPIAEILRKSQHEILALKHGTSRTLAELYLASETWPLVVSRFCKEPRFVADVEGLLADGLAERKGRGYKGLRLTDLGIQIAKESERKGELFSQKREQVWNQMREQLNDEE